MFDITKHDLAEFNTLRDFLRLAVSRFQLSDLHFGHGCDNAWDEAVYLSLHCLHLPPEHLDVFLDAKLLKAERNSLLTLFANRIETRLPAAYLTGEAWLMGYRFRVDQRVIVPRSFIARLLLEGHLEPWLEQPPKRVLDLCTGSGCLAILAALSFPTAQVDAVDCSPGAIAVASDNVNYYGMLSRLRLLIGDLFAPLANERYDLIIANPPYVNAMAMQNLPKEYRHEPELALDGGEDGLDLIRRIMQQAGEFLQRDGLLVMEIGHNREVFESAYPEYDCLWLETDGKSDEVLLLHREQLTALEATQSNQVKVD